MLIIAEVKHWHINQSYIYKGKRLIQDQFRQIYRQQTQNSCCWLCFQSFDINKNAEVSIELSDNTAVCYFQLDSKTSKNL